MNLASFKVKESYNMRGQAEDVSLTTGQSENHPKMVMLVGWGGNNGSTLTGGVIANREHLVGNQGQSATGQLLWLSDPKHRPFVLGLSMEKKFMRHLRAYFPWYTK
ncbi:hypothetical protein F8388_004646 [Cannabis sativa]|uniref:Inositol-3-phosphate synthase n=1 Tax=Cannabis sativa TaxID=3483 RepID=A0A7J6DS44_CANSA|nr:hypothetical protein F8388_004646 [Cannabis sativa]